MKVILIRSGKCKKALNFFKHNSCFNSKINGWNCMSRSFKKHLPFRNIFLLILALWWYWPYISIHEWFQLNGKEIQLRITWISLKFKDICSNTYLVMSSNKVVLLLSLKMHVLYLDRTGSSLKTVLVIFIALCHTRLI